MVSLHAPWRGEPGLLRSDPHSATWLADEQTNVVPLGLHAMDTTLSKRERGTEIYIDIAITNGTSLS